MVTTSTTRWILRKSNKAIHKLALCIFFICITFINVCLIPSHSYAQEEVNIAFIAEDDGRKQQELLEKTKHYLGELLPNAQLHLISFEDEKSINDINKYRLIISIGSDLTQKLLYKNSLPPTLVTFTSSMGYYQLENPKNHKISAIFLDQSAERYLSLIKIISPKTSVISLMYSDYSEKFQAELIQSAKKNNLSLITKKIKSSSDIYLALDEISKESDILIAIPDPEIYNRQTIKSIFLTTYQGGIPIIGFSGSYTKAGAISSIHSDTNDIAKQIAESIAYFSQRGEIPEKSHPKHFKVSTNTKVAHSLGIKLQSTELIEQQIYKMELDSDL